MTPVKEIKRNTPEQDEMIDLAGQMAEMFSFNRSIGQIFGCLYLSPTAMSLTEIARTCRMSKGNASIHLRTLHNWGAVHRASTLGDRKDYYRAESNLVELATRRIQEGAKKRIDFLRQTLDVLKAKSPYAEDAKQQAHWEQRLQTMEKLLKQAEKAYPLIMKYMEFRKLF